MSDKLRLVDAVVEEVVDEEEPVNSFLLAPLVDIVVAVEAAADAVVAPNFCCDGPAAAEETASSS